MKSYLVSVIVPCYNQGKFLGLALESVFRQVYVNWECIIINDGSEDETESVAKSWCKRDPRFKYFYKKNGGLSSARNFGLKKAKGEFLQFLDSDDFLDKNKFECSLPEGARGKIVISDFKDFTIHPGDSVHPLGRLEIKLFTFENIINNWDKTFNIPIHCGFFPVSIFQEFYFPEELKAKEDWIMWLYVFQKDIKIHFINYPLAFYRHHENGMSKNEKIMNGSRAKAMAYFPQIMPSHVYLDYFTLTIEKQERIILHLENKIKNYQKTRTYILSKNLQNNFFISWLHRLFVKFWK